MKSVRSGAVKCLLLYPQFVARMPVSITLFVGFSVKKRRQMRPRANYALTAFLAAYVANRIV